MSNINEYQYAIISGLSEIFKKSISAIRNITKFLLLNTSIIQTIGILSAVSLTNRYITDNTYSLNIAYNSIGICLLINTLFVKNEYILHHNFVNQLFLLSIYYKINIYHVLPLINFLIMIEISSIFLSMRYLFRILHIFFDKRIGKSKYNKKIKLANDILIFYIIFYNTYSKLLFIYYKK